MAIKVFNADDHPILRKGIVDLIMESDELEWVGSAANGQEAFEKISSIEPDIALLDIEMPIMSGIEVVQKLKGLKLKTKYVVLTLFKDASFIKSALNTGILGYLLKDSSEKEIIECIYSVYSGKAYVSPALSSVLINMNNSNDNALSVLTDHEINILKLIAKDKTTSEIADMMFISPKTVSNHRSNISKKLSLDGQQNSLLKWVISNKQLFD